MRALVVFESMFGNTEQVARAIAVGIAETMDVQVVGVSGAEVPADGAPLLVVGAPTHAFSLSRPLTRADANRQGAHSDPDLGLREWLERLGAGRHAEVAAAFDTRFRQGRHLPGSAARKAAKVLRHKGYRVAACESFYVEDTAGPLVVGELARATAWGRGLASRLPESSQGQPVA